MIEFKCLECGKQLKVKDEAAGKQGKCPQCGRALLVPQPETIILEIAKTTPKNQKHRRWIALLIVGAIIAQWFAPKFPLWFGIVLLVLCIVAFIPGVQDVSRRLLRLNPHEKWRSGLRLVMYGLIGLILIIVGRNGVELKAEQERIVAMQAATEVERQRLINEANAQIVSLVNEAETAWQQGDFALIKVKLEEAEKTPHATNLTPIQQLRSRIANAEVKALIAEATRAIKTDDLDIAKEKIKAALAVPHADALAEVKKLDEQISNATDPSRIRAILVELPEEAFQQLQKDGKMPMQLISGYESMDHRTADLTKAQLTDIVAIREQRRQEQLKQNQIAAHAVRKAKREQKAKEAANAEAKHKEKRKHRIEQEFSAWDGSHRGLTKVIKAAMNNPKSYEHVETGYLDMGDYLMVKTTFRGTNTFGGVVTNWVKAKVDLDGNVLEIIEKSP